MTETPLASIVIPTFRRPDILAELMAALLPQQKDTPTEILVIDNCPDASARAQVAEFAATCPALRYLHEARSGVVHARNTGVREATGTYILFLDDDEIPAEGWLEGFLRHARAGVTMASGRIVPRYEEPPQPGLSGLLGQLFSRDYPDADGADITRHHIELGTGNALFHAERCFPEANPFNLRFNSMGGEDIWLIKRLIGLGERIVWARDGLVEEFVPANRMTEEYLRRRRFNQGQLRCVFLHESGRLGDRVQVLLWMGVGALQALGYGARALIAGFAGSPRSAEYRARRQGGLGKLLWWRGNGGSFYASDA